jgi:hypothetical protein
MHCSVRSRTSWLRPPIVQAVAKVGGLVQTGAAEVLAAYQRAEFAKWGEVVRVSGANLN